MSMDRHFIDQATDKISIINHRDLGAELIG